MKIVCTALMAIIFFTACNTEIAEPSPIQLPEDPEQLRNLLSEEQDIQAKMDICYALYQLYRSSNPELAKTYLNEQRLFAEKLDDKLTIGKACYNLGLLNKVQGNYIEAVDWYLQSINHFDKIGDVSRISVVLDNIGVVFMETGNYEYARKFYDKTRKIHFESKEERKLVIATLNLGICSFSQKDPDYKAGHNFFTEAIELAQHLPEKRSYYLNRIYNYLGAMNYKKGDFEKAKEYYLESLKFIDEAESASQVKFIAFSNVGEAEMGAGNYEAAHEWVEKALALTKQEALETGLMISGYNIVGELFQREGRYSESVKVLEKAITISNNKVINEPLQETLKLIRVSYRSLNSKGKAVSADRYDNVLEIDGVQDQLEKDLVEKTNFQALQSALGMKIELDNTQKEKQAQAEMKMLFIAVAILLAILAVVIAIRLRTTRFERNQFRNKLSLAKYIANS